MQLFSRLRSWIKASSSSPTGSGGAHAQLSGVEDSPATEPTEPNQVTTSGDHNPLMDDAMPVVRPMDDVQHLRDLFCERVPTELVDFHEDNHVITIHTPGLQRVHNDDVAILSFSFADPRLAALLRRVQRVELVIKGHDQGWSDFSVDHGTTRGAWTWYSLGTSDPATHEGRLATNQHAVSETQTHGPYVWERDSKVVRMLQEAKVIEVWAHARFPGWVNHVEDAQMSIYLG